jgi:hypothetical protein
LFSITIRKTVLMGVAPEPPAPELLAFDADALPLPDDAADAPPVPDAAFSWLSPPPQPARKEHVKNEHDKPRNEAMNRIMGVDLNSVQNACRGVRCARVILRTLCSSA